MEGGFLMKEIWRVIKGHPDYEISSWGRVRKYLKHNFDPEGYPRVSVDREHKRIHQLIMENFGIKIHPTDIADHKDGNKGRSVLENLKYVTPRENTLNASKNGLLRYGRAEREIVGLNIADDTYIWFPSISQAAREIKCNNSEIVKCLSGKRKTAHGFKFWYVEDYKKQHDSEWLMNQENRQISMFE